MVLRLRREMMMTASSMLRVSWWKVKGELVGKFERLEKSCCCLLRHHIAYYYYYYLLILLLLLLSIIYYCLLLLLLLIIIIAYYYYCFLILLLTIIITRYYYCYYCILFLLLIIINIIVHTVLYAVSPVPRWLCLNWQRQNTCLLKLAVFVVSYCCDQWLFYSLIFAGYL